VPGARLAIQVQYASPSISIAWCLCNSLADNIMAAERTANLADDIAAFAYARENLLPELRKNGEHHSPNLTVTVGDESRPVIFSIPCLQGNACGASQTCPPFQLRQAFRRRVRFSMSRGPPLSSNIR
jgi:hypothetical protein